MSESDTIAALASPFGAGAVAVVRVSGSDALGICEKVFEGRRPLGEVPSGRVVFGRIVEDGHVVDEVLVSVFRNPRSYTGEDVVEVSGHGGVVVADAVLRVLFAAGARPAEPGEFTRRAFLNGKMDLTQAEAVMDLISARGEASARAAAGQLSGRLGRVVEHLREEILTALAHLEAFIDFPEEDIDAESGRALLERIGGISGAVARLMATADEGRMLREGVKLVIFGEPNAGKSSMLNLLVGYDRAMVSEIAGTTRDTIEENLTLRGIPFRVIDTAGLRESDDPLEVEGMRRTRLRLEEADVAVRVLDGSAWDGRGDGVDEVRVLNKIDVWKGGEVPEGVVPICCLDGRGLTELVDAIVEKVDFGVLGKIDEAIAVNARHKECLRTATEYLDATRRSLEAGDAPELTALELRSALVAIGEITGAVDTEEILGKIFSTFCIGK